jgi:hypothetical protein
MKVFRPISGSEYRAVSHDGPRSLTPSVTNTFAVSIPVQAGDLIGLNDQNAPAANNACLFASGSPEDVIALNAKGSDLGDGMSATLTPTLSGYKLNLTAIVQPPPGLSSIGTSSGPTTGGTSVVITGHDLTGATAVQFGATPASTFTVNSESQVTAASPPNSSPGPVDIKVTTAAGTTATSAADRFTYVAPPPVITCTVPKLRGKKLKAAKKALLKAECKLGKVKGKKSSSAKVKTQKPKSGTVLTAGSKVNVTVK